MTKTPFPILYEDNHLLVINKPVGFATQGTTDGNSVYDLITAYLKRKYNKPGNVYLGIVSRLDTVTSGVLLLARTSKAASRLTDMQRCGVIEKHYLAVVEGTLPASPSPCRNWVRKDESLRRMVVCHADSPQAKLAELKYDVLRCAKGKTMLRVELLTGRKHQIRLQLAHQGCPIVGDRKYGASKTFGNGIALHAHTLQLEHPVGKGPLSFETSPPPIWNTLPVASDA